MIRTVPSKETTNVGEVVEKGEPSYTVGGNASWYSHFGKQCGGGTEWLDGLDLGNFLLPQG